MTRDVSGLTHIACRDLGHAWDPRQARRTDTGFERTMVCLRCEAERKQKLDHRGWPAGATYGYPEGYLAPKGSGRMTREDRGAMRLFALGGWGR